MKCTVHTTDHSSSNGVCASCLRQRLSAVLAVQSEAVARAQTRQLLDSHRKSRANPPPLHFPRSVSPYISRRKSDTAPVDNYPKFFSTPQIDPTAAKKKKSKFSILSNLFKSRAGKRIKDSDHRVSDSTTSFGYEISPSAYSEDEEDTEHCQFEGNVYSSEEWKRTPKSSAVFGKRSGGGRMSNVSWNGFCLSPLVRASPNMSWGQKGCVPPEVVVSGDFRVREKPRHSIASPFNQFCKNGSRKLVDFGRDGRNY